MLKHVSASQVKTFRRCRSRWYHEKIDGHVEPPSEAMKRGTRIHSALEAYLVDGTPLPDTDEGRLATPALDRLPPAGSVPRDQVERRFTLPEQMLGVKFVGVIDLVDSLEGRVMISDHKTTSDFKYTKTEEELKADPQAQAYALAMREHGSSVRFRHVYIRTKGSPASRETVVDFDEGDIEHARERLKKTVGEMLATSQVDDVADVGHNLEACGDYGGCPHRARCASLGRQTLGVISSLFSNRKDKPLNDTLDPLAAMLAARSPAEAINPPDGTPEQELPEQDPQQELEELEPEKVTRRRRALRLPGVFDEDGVAVLVSRASKPQLVKFATENKVVVDPPEGRRKPGIREYRSAVEAFVAFIEDPQDDAPVDEEVEEVTETVTAPPVVEQVTETPNLDSMTEKVGQVMKQVQAAATVLAGVPEEPEEDTLPELTVYVNCVPRGQVTYLEDLLGPITREVERESGAPHYLSIPYNAGPKRVAGVFANMIRKGDVDVSGAIVVDMRLPASEAALEVLLPYADQVVRRF